MIKTDTKDISLYCLRNIDKLSLYKLADTDIQKLKILYSEREKVLKSVLLLERTQENILFTSKDIYNEVANVNQSVVKSLKKQFVQ